MAAFTTVFMIAHREASLDRCDVVLEFAEGTLTAVRRRSTSTQGIR
jgi:ABC-type transport system involved in cytochrome bd biosynthesis fused ATPase/permease subunit